MGHTKGKLEINDFSKYPIQIGRSEGKFGGCYIEDKDAGTIAIIPDFSKEHSDYKANAERFVKCWNAFEEGGSHDALLDELKMIVALLCLPGSVVSANDIEHAKVVIAAAEK